MTFNTKKSALHQHVMNFDHRIDRDNVKILKSESHAYRCRVAENFLINQKACSLNTNNRNNGPKFPAVYSVFTANKCLYVLYNRLCLWPPLVLLYNVTIFVLLGKVLNLKVLFLGKLLETKSIIKMKSTVQI